MKSLSNRGWGLQSMILLCGALVLALFLVILIVTFQFNSIFSNNNPFDNKYGNVDSGQIDESRTYNSMELQMVTAAKKYVAKLYKDGMEEGDPLYIRVSSLQNEKMLPELIDVKDAGISCSGYVKVLRRDGIDTYKPYLKCGKYYETDGYLARLDD